jgi:hypothetical protein
LTVFEKGKSYEKTDEEKIKTVLSEYDVNITVEQAA